MKTFLEFVQSKINIPKGNLGILRKDMPQIVAKDVPAFVTWLKGEGISTTKKNEPIASLKMTQKQINKEKVIGMINDASEDALSKPIIISKDNFILDGHHRFVALFNKNRNMKLQTYRVNVNMTELLELAHNFPKVITKGINENV
jgi:hypothetical protein